MLDQYSKLSLHVWWWDYRWWLKIRVAVAGDVGVQRFQIEWYHHYTRWHTCDYRPHADLPVAGNYRIQTLRATGGVFKWTAFSADSEARLKKCPKFVGDFISEHFPKYNAGDSPVLLLTTWMLIKTLGSLLRNLRRKHAFRTRKDDHFYDEIYSYQLRFIGWCL